MCCGWRATARNDNGASQRRDEEPEHEDDDNGCFGCGAPPRFAGHFGFSPSAKSWE